MRKFEILERLDELHAAIETARAEIQRIQTEVCPHEWGPTKHSDDWNGWDYPASYNVYEEKDCLVCKYHHTVKRRGHT